MKKQARFFKTAACFRAWLRKNHDSAKELHLGYYKKHTGRPSITWPQSVAVALCYGWIDGIRRRIDEDSYAIRFTPRRPRSNWSAVNIRLMAELDAAGKMTNAGRAVFQTRSDPDSDGYTYENKDWTLDAARLRAFKMKKVAWKFFETQPAGYRKRVIGWIMSAKKEETKDRRLAQLVEASATDSRLF
jgi:uncharacterized protein YdeI (YjbR/CyaY-like superfamily)